MATNNHITSPVHYKKQTAEGGRLGVSLGQCTEEPKMPLGTQRALWLLKDSLI